MADPDIELPTEPGADDITDIYRGIPADRTATRQSHLRKGVAAFLA
jgi:hypothetical protein